MNNNKLIETAIAALDNSYSPYSKYPVGTALLTKDGTIFTGCNIENASYGLTICAERTAIASAVAAGHLNFKAIAIATTTGNMPYPCGACLQVLSEFCDKDFIIITTLADKPESIEQKTLGDFLQHPFSRKE